MFESVMDSIWFNVTPTMLKVATVAAELSATDSSTHVEYQKLSLQSNAFVTKHETEWADNNLKTSPISFGRPR